MEKNGICITIRQLPTYFQVFRVRITSIQSSLHVTTITQKFTLYTCQSIIIHLITVAPNNRRILKNAVEYLVTRSPMSRVFRISGRPLHKRRNSKRTFQILSMCGMELSLLSTDSRLRTRVSNTVN